VAEFLKEKGIINTSEDIVKLVARELYIPPQKVNKIFGQLRAVGFFRETQTPGDQGGEREATVSREE
jgi:hypothetical protein